jgi:hypothetical protein
MSPSKISAVALSANGFSVSDRSYSKSLQAGQSRRKSGRSPQTYQPRLKQCSGFALYDDHERTRLAACHRENTYFANQIERRQVAQLNHRFVWTLG